MIHYRIDVSPASHVYSVELAVADPAPGQRLSLPAWIPGSYLVREFARHLSALEARQGGVAVDLRQIDKATWSASCRGGEPLVLRYRIYAFDHSVRAAFLDADRGFFNGTSICLRVEGREGEPHRLALSGLPAGWDVATTLPADGAAAHAFVAADYDELVDHPVELGRFWRGRFAAAGTVHEFAVAGAWPDFDGARLLADAQRICETTIAFWHGPAARPPFERYLFLLNAVEEGRGGLEHRASTALIAARRDLPGRGGAAAAAAEPGDGYVGLLGLVAHEYFHAWNVKRMRPRDFARLDYTRENYTGLLWFFEGFTSYYDDVLLVRSGRIGAARYLKLLATTVTAVLASPGRGVQSVAAASFDAWVKFYRADENTPNATVSYYAKGSLVALALDLTLRSEGRGTLDEVMRKLWDESAGGPIDEAQIAGALEAVGVRSYAAELAAWVHGTGELPLEPLLARFGVAWQRQPATLAQRLGVRVSESALTGVKVTHVLRRRRRPAGRAGRRRRSARDRRLAPAPARRRPALPGRRGRDAAPGRARPAPGRARPRCRGARAGRVRRRRPAARGASGRCRARAVRGMDGRLTSRRSAWRRVAFALVVVAVVAVHVRVGARARRPARHGRAGRGDAGPSACGLGARARTGAGAGGRAGRRRAEAGAARPDRRGRARRTGRLGGRGARGIVASGRRAGRDRGRLARGRRPHRRRRRRERRRRRGGGDSRAGTARRRCRRRAAQRRPQPPRRRGFAPFAWPASTRVTYVLTGNYRGEVSGQAQVEWIRVGAQLPGELRLQRRPANSRR